MAYQDADVTNASNATGAGQAAAAAKQTAPVAWEIESVAPNPDGTLEVSLIIPAQYATVTVAAADWSGKDAKGKVKAKSKTAMQTAIDAAVKKAKL